MKKTLAFVLIILLSLGMLFSCTTPAPSKLYSAFTPTEKAMLTDCVGEVVPFLPNDDYYVTSEENGIVYKTVGNTADELSAYLLLLSEYTKGEGYTEDGVEHSIYVKGGVTIDICSYTENEKLTVKLVIYPTPADDTTGGDNTTGDDTTGGDNTTGGDDTTGGDNNPGGDDTTGGDNNPGGEGSESNILKTGDQVVITAPAYGKLLSMTKTGFYNIGVDYTGTSFSAATNNEIFTVTINSDGSYTFTSLSGEVLALGNQYTSLDKAGQNSKWTLEAVSGKTGVYLVKNTARENYLEWYAEKNNWSTYSDPKDNQYEISFYYLNGTLALGQTSSENEGGGATGGGDNTGSGNAGNEGYIYSDFDAEEKQIFTQYVGGVIPFVPTDEYYVEGWDEQSDLGYEYGIHFYTFGNTEADFNLYRALLTSSGYELDSQQEDNYGDTWYYYTNGDIVIEASYYYYEGDDVIDIYIYSLTLSLEPNYGEDDTTGGNGGGTTGGEGATTGKTLETGDQVVITAPAYGVLLSMTKAGFYNIGVDYTGTSFSAATNNEIFTVTINSDGSYTFTSLTGKVLALADEYNSLNEEGLHNKWVLRAVNGKTGVYYVENVGRGNYLEWYADEDNWTTFYDNKDDQFEISFRYLDGSLALGQTSSESEDGGNGDVSDVTLFPNDDAGLPEDDGDGVHDVDLTVADKVKDVTDQGSYLDGCPTTGSPAVLVVPVQFSDVTADSKGYTIDALKQAFLKDGECDYYSLYDYYFAASYGKLTLDITVLDEWFTPKYTSDYYKNAKISYYGEQIDGGDQLIMDELLAYLSALPDVDLSDYDSDNNGYIDSIVLINTLEVGKNNFNWAYRYWNLYADDNNEYYMYDNVCAYDYIWASYAFLHDDGNDYDNTSLMNTYTFIHEFGHVLGADDYYDTAYVEHPLGGHDVMDAMTGDHSAFTKFNLGWITTSRLVTGDNVTLELESFSKGGDTIIIANDWSDALGAYQEYYIIVFYTADGLNSPDKGAGIFEEEGVVVYHINATLYVEDYDGELFYDIYNNNTDISEENGYGTEDNLIELVEVSEGDYVYGAGDSLASDIADDSGEALGYTFTVNSIGRESVSITFERV